MHLYYSCQELTTAVRSLERLAEAARKLTAAKTHFRVDSPSCHIKPQHICILILLFIMPHVSERELQTICAAASKKRKASLDICHPKDDTHKDNTPNGGTPSNNLPNGDTPDGDAPSGDAPSGDTPYEDPLYSHTSDDNFGFISYSSDWLEDFSDAEDEWPISEPEAGWKEAERKTTRATPHFFWHSGTSHQLKLVLTTTIATFSTFLP